MAQQQPIKVESELIYASISANRSESNISCQEKYLLYSRCRCPILYDTESKQTVAQLIGHNDEVNGQCFISDDDQIDKITKRFILSTSHDKSAIIWEISSNKLDSPLVEYKLLFNFKSPDDSVFTTRCSIKQGDQFTSITATLEGNIYIWKNDHLVQTITTKYCCFDSNLFDVQIENDLKFTFLFLAGSDNKVHIFQLYQCSLNHLFDLSGYNDWIKCLDNLRLSTRQNEFLLATASQDCFIRVWHMKLVDHEVYPTRIRTLASKPLSSPLAPTNKEFRLTATLETVLSGHEGIVHGLCWFKKQPEPTLQLISCSADKTIIIWRSSMAPLITNDSKKYEHCPASSEIWKEIQRVGETGETNLPFLGLCLSNDEKTFFGHSLRGAIHSWSLKLENGIDIWSPNESITGHFDSVTDLSWERSGSYLLSASLDKTCRMHAISSIDNKWHEITRPQVHGHEINCLALLDFFKFATGAEEKTIRIFGATKFFIKNFKALANAKMPENLEFLNDELPIHAQLPALGLSNRGAHCPYDMGDVDGKQNSQNTTQDKSNNEWSEISNLVKQLAQLEHLTSLPSEEILLQSTLWWETNKLFGHSNELHALATDSSGAFLASASKANRSDLANIIVWETLKFRKVATIEHHTLTITRLKFSPDDRYLLSVSRDRTWCISERSRSQHLRNAYKRLVGSNKTNAIHERIIWDCSWTYDSKYFLTVSRDKKAILWSIEDIRSQFVGAEEQQGQQQLASLSCATSKLFDRCIQAVDSPMGPILAESSYLFALGFEDGSLELWSIGDIEQANLESQWCCLGTFANFHQLSIRRLTFQPKMQSTSDEASPTMEKSQQSEALLLASGGDDCIVKLTKLILNC